MSSDCFVTNYKLLPAELHCELQHIRKERDPKQYFANYSHAIMLIICLVLIVLLFGFIMIMIDRTGSPAGLINYGWLANLQVEIAAYTVLIIALPLLFLLLLIELFSVWGKCELFNSSFGLVRRTGSRVEFYDYGQMEKVDLSHKSATEDEPARNKKYAGSVINVITSAGKRVRFDFNNRQKADAFYSGIKERFGRTGTDPGNIAQANPWPFALNMVVYPLISMLFGAAVVNTILIPAHNADVIESSKSNILISRDGETVVTEPPQGLSGQCSRRRRQRPGSAEVPRGHAKAAAGARL